MRRRTSSESIVAVGRSFMPRGVASPASRLLSKITIAVSDPSGDHRVIFDGPALRAGARGCAPIGMDLTVDLTSRSRNTVEQPSFKQLAAAIQSRQVVRRPCVGGSAGRAPTGGPVHKG